MDRPLSFGGPVPAGHATRVPSAAMISLDDAPWFTDFGSTSRFRLESPWAYTPSVTSTMMTFVTGNAHQMPAFNR